MPPLRILHLEDRAFDAELVADTLDAAGLAPEVMRVDTERDFLSALEHGGFDLILSDFSLPGFDGASALELATKCRPDIPFMFVSGTLGEETAVEMLKRGATDYVLKDRPSRLPAAVRRALQDAEERRSLRAAEQALRDRDEFIRRVTEASPIVLAVFDLGQGRLVYAGGAVERVLGCSADELLASGPDVRRRFDAEDLAGLPGALAQLRDTRGGLAQGLVRARHPDGVWHTINIRATVFARAEDGEPTQVLAVLTDVSTERLAQQRRDTQYAVTAILADSAPLGEAKARIARAIGAGLGFSVVEWWDPGAAGAASILAASWAQAPGPQRFVEATRALRLAPGEGLPPWASEPLELRLFHDLGREPGFKRAALATDAGLRTAIAVPLSSPDHVLGVLVGMFGEVVVPDEDLMRLLASLGSQLGEHLDRDRGRAALRVSEERFQLLARATNDVIWDWDPHTDRVWWNETLRSLFGYGLGGAGSTYDWWVSRVHPDERERTLAGFDAALAGTAESWSGEYRFQRADGSYATVIDRVSLVRDRNGRVRRCIGSMLDISERKRLEEQVLRTQRMEGLGNLAGGLAHDLNNMLAPILTAVELLRVPQSVERARRFLDAIESSAQRGAAMVKQILAFARGGDGLRVILDPGIVLGEVEAIVRYAFPARIELRTRVETGLWPVSADATQLHQVLFNLCVNGRDSMPEGGVLELAARNENLAASARGPAGPYVVLSVRDTGSGMPPDVLARIFEPFFSTKDAGRGTGLGLSTSLAIVRKHGGFIDVCSEPGQGTTFAVYLPAVADMPAEPGPAPRPAQGGQGELILVVDDEASILEITKEALENFGYRVLTASDGMLATTLFATRQEPISVVISDLTMPTMDGAATMRALRHLDPQVRLIATSGMGASDAAREGEDLAGVVFLQKPFTIGVLLEAIHQVLER